MTTEIWSDLPDRERHLIHHVFRYWLTTISVVQRWHWPDLSRAYNSRAYKLAVIVSMPR